MKKYYLLSLIFLFTIILVVSKNNLSTKTSESFAVYEKDGYYFSKYGKIKASEWKKLSHKDIKYENEEMFLLEVDYYVDAITNYIDSENWKDVYADKHGEDFEFKINFKFPNVGSSVIGGYEHFKYLILEIYLGREHIELNRAPIAHEITHLIKPYYSSLTLREGLACFIQDSIGKNPSIPNNGNEIIPLSKEYLIEDNRAVINVIGTKGIPKDINLSGIEDSERKAFYILSYSFSKYLIDEYGIEKFMEVYEAEDLNKRYKDVYGKKLEGLRSDWINHVMQYKAS